MKRAGRGRRGALGLVVALLAGAWAGVWPTTAASGTGEVVEVVGILRIHLQSGGASTITYEGPLDVPSTQAIEVDRKCGVTTGGTLLSITPAGGSSLGLVGNGLGVRTATNCSTGQGRISAGQSITLALGSAFPADVRVGKAELDIEGKHGAKLGVQRDGGSKVTIPLRSSADNGPDSGVHDNSRVVLSQDFRSLTLFPVGGSVSLEGGGDGPYSKYKLLGLVGPIGQSLGTADTILKLVRPFDHALPCEGDVSATVIGGAAISAELHRGLNEGATTPDECEDIPVTLVIDDTGVLLRKSTTGLQTGAEQAVHAQLTITWAPIGPPAPVPLPARQIDFDGPEGTAFDFEDVQRCVGRDAEGDAIHPADARFPDGVLPWCLVDNDEQMLDDGSVVQVQVYDGSGDPYWR